jgi:hypothetical protein
VASALPIEQTAPQQVSHHGADEPTEGCGGGCCQVDAPRMGMLWGKIREDGHGHT